jgi:hypothetical protein
MTSSTAFTDSDRKRLIEHQAAIESKNAEGRKNPTNWHLPQHPARVPCTRCHSKEPTNRYTTELSGPGGRPYICEWCYQNLKNEWEAAQKPLARVEPPLAVKPAEVREVPSFSSTNITPEERAQLLVKQISDLPHPIEKQGELPDIPAPKRKHVKKYTAA